jgi:hypothetical protein
MIAALGGCRAMTEATKQEKHTPQNLSREKRKKTKKRKKES